MKADMTRLIQAIKDGAETIWENAIDEISAFADESECINVEVEGKYSDDNISEDEGITWILNAEIIANPRIIEGGEPGEKLQEISYDGCSVFSFWLYDSEGSVWDVISDAKDLERISDEISSVLEWHR